MKKIQSLLEKFETIRVEIYSSHLVVHDFDKGTEQDFDSKKEVIKYLKSL